MEVDAQHVGHLVGPVLPRPPPLGDAGVVDQDVEATELVDHASGEGVEPVELAQVDGPRATVGRPLLDLGEDRLQPVGPPGAQPDHRTPLGQSRREGGAQPR